MSKDGPLFKKYSIMRTDAMDLIEGDKHFKCSLFVLDVSHDKYAREALAYYAHVCYKTHPQLAYALSQLLEYSEPTFKKSEMKHQNIGKRIIKDNPQA